MPMLLIWREDSPLEGLLERCHSLEEPFTHFISAGSVTCGLEPLLGLISWRKAGR
jgi:hypothetical protein